MPRPSHSAIARYEQRLLAYERSTAADERAPTVARPRRASDRTRRHAGRVSARVRTVRISILAAVLMLMVTGVSFTSTMMQPSNVGFGVRAVEWLRDNGAAGLVSRVEAIYYSFTAPSTGGPGIKSLPMVGVVGAASSSTYRPPPISPVIHPALPGEGVWRGTGPIVRGAPPVFVTTFRPDPNYPAMVAGVAWIDSSRAWIQLYPGRYEPANSVGAAADVPPQLRGALLATFNSGFKLEDDNGGFVAFGHAYSPLRVGQATLLRYRDGSADIRTWTGGPNPGPTVELARQNLPLIVTGGQLNQNLSDGPEWGATLGNAVRVWRSGIGVDGRGNLIYAAAKDQTATSLAQILQRAGAVRAMELDINSEWVTFNFYAAADAVGPAKLLPDMTRDPTRYLTPDDRDFFAVYAR
jgi:Phosphodiester glycosidase